LFLGIIAGAGIKGDFPEGAADYHANFIAPWLNWFSFSVGLFTVSICGYLASVFIIGDVEPGVRRLRHTAKARLFLAGVVLFGGLVFLLAALEDLPFLDKFREHPLSIAAVTAATSSLPLLWWWLKRQRFILARIAAAGQVTLILVAIYAAMFPDFVLGGGQKNLDLFTAAAPAKTINMLGWALIGGLAVIGPSVAWLMWVFKGQSEKTDSA
jgi:cytochrome d ubiquinol oxidase subunit II